MYKYSLNIQKKKMSEVVTHANNFAPQIAEFVQSNEALADPATRRDYFEHLGTDDFIDFTQQIASLVRTGDSTQMQHFDGATVSLMGHEVPDQREKETLLRETWDTAKSFLIDRTITDEDALEYAGLTVAGGVLLAHPFADGNGRTSRYASYIVSRGAENIDSLNAMSQSLSGEWQVAPSRKIVLREPRSYTAEQPEDIEWEFQFAGESEDAMGGIIADSVYKNRVVHDFIEQADPETKQLVEICATRNEDGSMASLDGDKFIATVVNDPDHGIRNAQYLKDIKRSVQASYVRDYLRGMRNNLRSERRVLDERDITLTEGLSDAEQTRKKMMAKVVGERAVNGQILIRDEAVAQHRAYSSAHTRS